MDSTKKCAKCGEIKLLKDFTKQKTSKDGFYCYCRLCSRENRKESYLKNRDKELKACSEYHKMHRKERAEAARLRKLNDPRRMSQISRNSYVRCRDKDSYRNSYLKREFGITIEEYKQMHGEQDGKCAICLQEETARHPSDQNRIKRLAVDHCHTTGQVRGLLCDNCNRGIGLFKEDETRLTRAINYLNERKRTCQEVSLIKQKSI